MRRLSQVLKICPWLVLVRPIIGGKRMKSFTCYGSSAISQSYQWNQRFPACFENGTNYPQNRESGIFLTKINLCSTLEPDQPFTGYEFIHQGLALAPLSKDHILYTKSGNKESCFCSGSCSYNHFDPLQECDFKGGIQLEFFNPTNHVSVDVINPFTNVILTAYTIQGDILTNYVLKGNALPQSLSIDASGITKVELRGLRKCISFQNIIS